MDKEWVRPRMAAVSRVELRAEMEARSSPEAEGKEDSFSSFWACIFFFFFLLMTNTHTTLAKSRGVWGSSQWCRACLEKIWETCNPEADLARQIQIGHQWYKIYSSFITHCRWILPLANLVLYKCENRACLLKLWPTKIRSLLNIHRDSFRASL